MVRDRQGRIYIWASMGCRPGVPSLQGLHHLNKYIDTQGCGGGGGGGGGGGIRNEEPPNSGTDLPTPCTSFPIPLPAKQNNEIIFDGALAKLPFNGLVGTRFEPRYRVQLTSRCTFNIITLLSLSLSLSLYLSISLSLSLSLSLSKHYIYHLCYIS